MISWVYGSVNKELQQNSHCYRYLQQLFHANSDQTQILSLMQMYWRKVSLW